ncbi:hypothetical protein BDV18DRAFT_133106 [Aspergillus unguis]
MPRRSRAVEYDDVIDDDIDEVYPSRHKADPLVLDRDIRPSHRHRLPRGPGPAAEIRRPRDRLKPELPSDGFEFLRDDVLAAERLARLDLNAYRAEEASRPRVKRHSVHVPQAKPRGRRRSRMSDVEEAYFSGEDSGGYTESEPDEIDGYIESKRSLYRHAYDPRKEALPRSKSLKDERKMRRSKFDDGPLAQSSRSLNESARDKKGARIEKAPRTRHRSHYHLDIVDDETDPSDETESESEVDVVPKRGRPGVRKGRVEQKIAARKRRTSSSSSFSSSSSSPESAGSSEEELPKVPLPVPVPPVYKESRRHKAVHGMSQSMAFSQLLIVAAPAKIPQIPRPPSPPSPPSPPRVPNLETVLNEREARHKKRKEKAAKEEVEIERRSRESLRLSQEPARRPKSKPMAIVEKPAAIERRDLIIEDERADPRVSYEKREIIDEDFSRGRDPRPSRGSPSSDTMDEWAIVQAPFKSKHSPSKHSPAKDQPVVPVVDVHEEPEPLTRPRRPKDRAIKPTFDEMEDREPTGKHKGDTPRGKVGPRYIGVKDRRERLWTEITKDLVVREAIERAGYEYEEFDSVYYIFSYLHPDDVDALVDHSDAIRRARRRRIQEIQRERSSGGGRPSSRRSPRSPHKSAPLLVERPPSPPVPPSPPSPPPPPPGHSRERRRGDRRDDRRRRERVREEDVELAEGHWMGRAPPPPPPGPPGRW